MSNWNLIGTNWTHIRLKQVIDALRASERDVIIKKYWEYVPEGDYSDVEKMKFIICAIPNSIRLPKSSLLHKLRQGPVCVKPVGSYDSKPELLKRIREADATGLVSKYAELYSRYKLCPNDIRGNEDWVMLVALEELSNLYPGVETVDDWLYTLKTDLCRL